MSTATLPKQAQRDLDEVTAIEEAMKAQQAEKDMSSVDNVVSITQPVQDTPEPAPTAEIAPVAKEVTPEVSKDNVEKDTRKAEDAEYWKQRFSTVQGLLNQQVSQSKESVAKVQELSIALAALTEQVNKPAADPVSSSVTDAEEEAFGRDLIDVQRRIAREAVAPVMAQVTALEKENNALRELLGKTGSRVETMSFEQRLQATVPDFEQVNLDPKWVAWLDEVDPILRGPRRSVAQAAFESGDAEAVAEYVKLFRAMTAKPAAPTPDKNEAELRSQVAPNRTVTAPAPDARGGEKFYTEAEASKAFDRVSALNRAGKYEEASKLEADLTAAYSTGRVR